MAPVTTTVEMPLLGAYAARRCPVAVGLDHDATLAVEPLGLTDAQQARVDAGIAHQDGVELALMDAHGGSVTVVPDLARRDAQEATTLAMWASRTRVIIGGWLPDDVAGRRVGRPDLLVRHGEGWAPIEVKWHRVTYPAKRSSIGRGSLDAPWPERSETVAGVALSSDALGDVLQLAHYWRMLEAMGATGGDRPLGGLVDRDGALWWVDLAEERWGRPARAAMDRYDAELALRLRVVERQMRINRGEPLAPAVVPLRKSECKECAWREVCEAEMAAADCVSLTPGARWEGSIDLRRAGVATRAALASLDWGTARAACGDVPKDRSVDLVSLMSSARGSDPAMSLRDLVGRKASVAERRLGEAGMSSAGDLFRLDARTAEVARSTGAHLPGLIDAARAALAGGVYLARGVERVDVPRADVEIDIDLECSDDGVYLWGIRVARGAGLVPDGAYRGFASWENLRPEVEVEVLARAWSWMSSLRTRATRAGLSFACYHYGRIEATEMRRIATSELATEPAGPLMGFLAGGQMVDLHEVVRRHLVTGGSAGLKRLGRLAGFSWRDDDPGGVQSMSWYVEAVSGTDPEAAEAARERILAYNEDDCAATAALRDWLGSQGFEAVSSLGAGGSTSACVHDASGDAPPTGGA